MCTHAESRALWPHVAQQSPLPPHVRTPKVWLRPHAQTRTSALCMTGMHIVQVRVRSKKSGVLVASGMAKVSALVGFNPDVSRRRFPGMPGLPPGSTPTAREPSKL